MYLTAARVYLAPAADRRLDADGDAPMIVCDPNRGMTPHFWGHFPPAVP